MIQALLNFVDHNFSVIETGVYIWLAGSLVFLAVAIWLRHRA